MVFKAHIDEGSEAVSSQRKRRLLSGKSAHPRKRPSILLRVIRLPHLTLCFLPLLVTAGAATGAAAAQTEDRQAVIQLLHSASDAMRHGDSAAAENLFQRVIAAAPGLSDGYLGLGMVQLHEGKFDGASRQLLHATELNPKLPGAHMFLGIAQYQMGDAEASAASLRAELVLQPDSVETLTWLGIVELGVDHPELATEPLDHALTLSPRDANLLYYDGRAHKLVAERAYKQLYQLDPDSALVHRALAEDFSASGQPEKALVEYEAANRKEPGNADLLEAIGEANQSISRLEKAAAAYEQALAVNPNSAIALYNLGKIRVEGGKPEEGVAMLRKAQSAHARPAPTAFYLGLGLAELNQPAEAAQWLEQSLASHPSPFIEQSAYYQLARVYQKLNRKADAQQALEQLKRLKAEAAQQMTQKQNGVQDASAPPPDPQPESELL